MDVMLTFAVLVLVAVISGLQTCSSGSETSSTQILLDVSTTQINTTGGMCSCRLTVSQTTRVDMFTGSWTPGCDSYMTIPKWRTSTLCTNGVVRTLPAQTNTVTTGEEIWILVVATKPGVKGLSGQLQFKVKQPSAKLNIECFEPNTNSSTTTTPITTSTTTTTPVPTTTVPTTTTPTTTSTATTPVPTTTVTSMTITSTRPTTSTESTTDNTSQTQTAATGDTSTSSSAEDTSGSAATPAGSTQASTPTQGAIADNTKGIFPGGIFAAGVATGTVLVLIAGGLYVVISRRQWWTSRRQKPDDIPISEAHPTYSGFTSRTEEAINTYDTLDPKPSKGTDNPYINVS